MKNVYKNFNINIILYAQNNLDYNSEFLATMKSFSRDVQKVVAVCIARIRISLLYSSALITLFQYLQHSPYANCNPHPCNLLPNLNTPINPFTRNYMAISSYRNCSSCQHSQAKAAHKNIRKSYICKYCGLQENRAKNIDKFCVLNIFRRQVCRMHIGCWVVVSLVQSLNGSIVIIISWCVFVVVFVWFLSAVEIFLCGRFYLVEIMVWLCGLCGYSTAMVAHQSALLFMEYLYTIFIFGMWFSAFILS